MTGNRLLLLRSDLCMLSHPTSTWPLLMVSMIFLPTYLSSHPVIRPPTRLSACQSVYLISLCVLSHQDSATLLVLLMLPEKISEYLSAFLSVCLLWPVPDRGDIVMNAACQRRWLKAKGWKEWLAFSNYTHSNWNQWTMFLRNRFLILPRGCKVSKHGA